MFNDITRGAFIRMCMMVMMVMMGCKLLLFEKNGMHLCVFDGILRISTG